MKRSLRNYVCAADSSMTEHQLYEQIALYMQTHYPDVIYRFDLAADLKLTPGQARKHKKVHPHRGYPDLFIAEPALRCVDGSWNNEWHGLFVEIKRIGTRLKKKNGEWVNEHIAEQAEMLDTLEFRGYRAAFAVGLIEAIEIIDEYLGGEEHEMQVWRD